MIDKTEQEIMKNWKGDRNKPLVSICTIAYNHEKYIAESLDSFLMQKTNFPFEMIIDDDHSPDNTVKVIQEYIKKYPNIINAHLRDKNVGMMVNFTENMKRAQGEYIALCEGDDYWIDPLKLQKQVSFLESHKEYNMVFHNAEYQDHTERGVTIKPFNPEEKNRDYTADEILIKWTIPTASVLCRNEGQYRYLEDNLWFPIGDAPYFIKCASLGKLYYMADTMSVYRRVPSGMTNSEEFKGLQTDLAFIEYFKVLYNDFSDLLSKKTINHVSALRYLWAARKYRKNGNKKDYLQYLTLAMVQDPELIYEKEFQLNQNNLKKIADKKFTNLQNKYNMETEIYQKKLDIATNSYNLIMKSLSNLIRISVKAKPLQKITAYKSLTKTYFKLQKSDNDKELASLYQKYRPTKINIISDENNIIFLVEQKTENTQIAFYLYKNNERVDIKWYSKEFSYKLDKSKYGKGEYWIQYFIIDGDTKDPGATEKKEIGYSEHIAF